MIERDLRAARDRLQKQLDALNDAIRQSELRAPDEPYVLAGGAVITFTKHFGNADGKGYQYAAVGYRMDKPVAKAVAFARAYDGVPYQFGSANPYDRGGVIPARKANVPSALLIGVGKAETEVVNRWAVTGEAGRTCITWEELVAFVKEDEAEFAQHALDSITVWQRPE